jgi:hypothetical protein
MKSMALLSVLSASCVLAHAGAVEVTLINLTGYPMGSVSMSPAQKNEWSGDKLDQKRLDNGSARRLILGDLSAVKKLPTLVYEDDTLESVQAISGEKSSTWVYEDEVRAPRAPGQVRPKKRECLQDVRVVFDDEGDVVIWPNIDVCNIDTLTLVYNRSTGMKLALPE